MPIVIDEKVHMYINSYKDQRIFYDFSFFDIKKANK